MVQNSKPTATIRPPENQQEWESYFQLRFSILREPWGQAKGSEVLTDEDQATHAAAFDENGTMLGVARLQTNSPTQGQVRCVAVSTEAQGKGIGKLLMDYLENIAQEKGMTEIVLDARINALEFYKSIDYEVIAESYLLFGEIPHWKMRKVF